MDTQPNPKLEIIDSVMLTPLVRQSINRANAQIVDWKSDKLYGASPNSETYRFFGNALDQGEVFPWSLILKIIRSFGDKDDPASLNYWKREALAYQSGILDQLPSIICAPHSYAIVQQAGLEIWLWIEEIVDEIRGGWPLEQYGNAARHLGLFNGAYFEKQSLLQQPWLAKGRLRAWTGNAAPDVPPHIRKLPLVSRVFQDGIYEWMQRVWLEHHTWLNRIEHQPQTLSHLDAFRRNLFARRNNQGNLQTVLIDWSGVGSAAPGEEIAPLVAASLNFLEVDSGQAIALDQIVFDGYIEGLLNSGWQGDPRAVRETYIMASILKYCVGVYGVAFMIADENQHSLLERAFGHPVRELVDAWSKTYRFLRHLADELRRP